VYGPINATAPAPVQNRTFAETIGTVMRRPAWLPVPGLAVRLMMGEMADMVVTGQRVIPRRALDHGYQFAFPTLEPALRDILR